jgi:hypothetical protein
MLQLRILKGIPQWLIWLVKILVAAFAVRFILVKVFRNESIDELSAAFKSLQDNGSVILLIIVFSLLIANLLTETIKWKIIMKPLESIPMLKSFAAVLTGIAVSFFAPNRSGEFVGRILFVEHADKIKTSLVTILASIGQLVITISVGCICLIFFLKDTIESSWLYYPLASTLVLLSAALIFLFIYFPYIAERFSSLSMLKRFSEYISVMKLYKPKVFLSVISLSLFRYYIFVHQYFLLQKIFFPETPYSETLQLISIIYLALAVIPTFALSEIGIRSSVAMFYLGSIISNPVSIALATLCVWIINIAFPSLIGSILFLAVKFGNGKNNSTT